MFVNHSIAAAGQRQREQWNDGRSGPNRQRRKRGRGRGRPPEKIDRHRVGARHVLIDQDADALAFREQPQRFAHRPAPIDDGIAIRRSNPFEQIVQLRIIQRPRHDGHRLELQRVRQRLLFPEPEMPGAKQHAFPLRKRELYVLFAFPLDERHLLFRRQRWKLQQLQHEPAEMAEHLPCDGAALIVCPLWKCRLQVRDSDTLVDSVGEVKRQAEPLADAGAPHSTGTRSPRA